MGEYLHAHSGAANVCCVHRPDGSVLLHAVAASGEHTAKAGDTEGIRGEEVWEPTEEQEAELSTRGWIPVEVVSAPAELLPRVQHHLQLVSIRSP